MTASNLYRLAERLESGFMTPADMKAWAQDVRAHANTVKRTVLVEPQGDRSGESSFTRGMPGHPDNDMGM